jgi:DNA-binding MarR family transcriptional regulator
MTIRDRVLAYIKAHPYSQGKDIAAGLDLEYGSVSSATRELKKDRLIDFTEGERSGKGRFVTWFERGVPPVKVMDEDRYAQFLAMMEAGKTRLEMKHELRCSTDKLRQWAQRARYEGVEVKEAPPVAKRRGGSGVIAGRPYATGLRWSIGHVA